MVLVGKVATAVVTMAAIIMAVPAQSQPASPPAVDLYPKLADCSAFHLMMFQVLTTGSKKDKAANVEEASRHQKHAAALLHAAAAFVKKKPSEVEFDVRSRNLAMVSGLNDPAKVDRMVKQHATLCTRLGNAAYEMATKGQPKP